MEGLSMSLLVLFSTLAYVQFARCSPFPQTPGTVNIKDHSTRPFPGNNTLKEKCLKNGGEIAYKNLKAADVKGGHCIFGVFNPGEFRKEWQELQPTGKNNVFIKKYCGKVPAIKECFNILYPALDECLDQTEKLVPKNFKTTFEATLNFLCPKEESPLSAFIKDGGRDCMNEKDEELKDCGVSAFDKYYDNTLPLPFYELFKYGKQECKDLHDYHECFVKELKKCKKQTPAELAESLFSFVEKQTPCDNEEKAL